MLDDIGHLPPPLLLAQTFKAPGSHTVLERPALAIRQMTELHRLQHAVDDHGRAEAGAKPEEQHPAALIAAESLHQGVVDHPCRLAERLFKVESDPALAEIMRL